MLSLTNKQTFWLLALVAFATIAGAWIFEYFGYAPCELCLKQRWAYYAGVPLAALFALASGGRPGLARNGFLLLAVLWAASMVFGIYHAGVEWKFWQGPTACTGGGSLTGLPDLSKPAVMCDAPALRIFGLSLAGWNAVISAALAFVAARAFLRQGSSSVSQ
ncbi:disulfide bond formation protein B [Aestuariivirga sp.]|uniref:disulfide bond formation protein B n=1 Tax=Aestuariivirga sp. TaxID=2650926 RepID=UPI0039E6068F